jgi:CRP-like cAMP-binding protein
VRPEDLKHFALLAELSDEDREVLVELLEERVLPDGKSIFREGAEGDGLVLLQAGQLRLESRRAGDVIGTLEAPQHLGAASLFGLGKREVTALAQGPATVWLLSRSGLARLLEDAPRAAFRIAEAVAAELSGLVRQRLDTLTDHDLA